MRRDDLLDHFAACIDAQVRELLPDAPSYSPVTAAGIVGGVEALLYSRLNKGETDDLDALLPSMMYFLVLPFEGQEAASEELALAAELAVRHRPAASGGETVARPDPWPGTRSASKCRTEFSRCYTRPVPTTKPRYVVTDAGAVTEMLDVAQRRWPKVTDRKALLLLLAETGRGVIEREESERRAAAAETAGALSGVYAADELKRLREDWPE